MHGNIPRCLVLSDDCGTACPLQVSLFFVRTSLVFSPGQINTVVLSLVLLQKNRFNALAVYLPTVRPAPLYARGLLPNSLAFARSNVTVFFLVSRIKVITALRVLSVSLHAHNGDTANGVLFGVCFFLVGAPCQQKEEEEGDGEVGTRSQTKCLYRRTWAAKRYDNTHTPMTMQCVQCSAVPLGFMPCGTAVPSVCLPSPQSRHSHHALTRSPLPVSPQSSYAHARVAICPGGLRCVLGVALQT